MVLTLLRLLHRQDQTDLLLTKLDVVLISCFKAEQCCVRLANQQVAVALHLLLCS